MKNKDWLLRGMRNGIPICLGYFAVSFALGIAARNVGMDAIQAGYMSVTMVASAGEFAAIGLVGSSAGLLEVILTTLVVNMRYFLMSLGLAGKLTEGTKPVHRFVLPFFVTDEIFGLSATVEGPLNPFYTYGIAIPSIAGWFAGTVLGVIVGNILPVWAVNGLSVAMYGMFLAIVIPPVHTNRFIGLLVAVSMAASGLFSVLPYLSRISSGFRVIILTVLIAGIASVLKPVSEEEAFTADRENKKGGRS